jgi:tripartite-type tricarboxylate transporter receptor subunit TctC
VVFAAQSSAAQEFPQRSIRLVVGYSPGGGTDLLLRLLARKLTASWGQSVVVDNRPGAGGILGTEIVALAKRRPGELTFASAGVGSTTHLAGECFKRLANIDALHVPYKGSGQAEIDLAGGQVHDMIDSLPAAIGSKLQTEIVRSMNRPDVKDLVLRQGADTWTIGAQEFSQFLRQETELYARIVRDAGITIE